MEPHAPARHVVAAVIQYWMKKCGCGAACIVVRSGSPPAIHVMCVGCNSIVDVKLLSRKYRTPLPLIHDADKDVDNALLDFLNEAGPNLGHSQMIRRVTVAGRPFAEAIFEVFKEMDHDA